MAYPPVGVTTPKRRKLTPGRPRKNEPLYEGEIASAADDIYRPFARTYNPDLLATKKGGLSLYKTMREDDQIKAALKLKKAAATTSGWAIDGDNEEHVDFMNYTFDQMRGTVEEMIDSILSAFEYGFSVHEKVYEYYDNGPYAGKIGIRAVKAKSPTRIDFEIDQTGELKGDGLLQRQDTGKVDRLPIDKFLIFSYQKEFDNYYGESDLKAAYRPYFVKSNVLRYWAIYLERFSIPIAKGTTKSGRVTSVQRAAFQTVMRNIQAGMSVLLPTDIQLELLESSRVDKGVFGAAIAACNIAMARAILIPQTVGLVPQDGVGSYGKSETDLKIFDWILKDINRRVMEVVNEQLIRQLIDINFGAQQSYPKFIIKPLTEEDKTRLVAAWSEAVARGAVTPTVETQKHVRELLSFPEVEGDEESTLEKAEKILTTPREPAGGTSGLSGKNSSGGKSKQSNYPGGANQYSVLATEVGRSVAKDTLKNKANPEKIVLPIAGRVKETLRMLCEEVSQTVCREEAERIGTKDDLALAWVGDLQEFSSEHAYRATGQFKDAMLSEARITIVDKPDIGTQELEDRLVAKAKEVLPKLIENARAGAAFNAQSLIYGRMPL